MAGLTTPGFDALLQDVYRGPMITQFNDDTFLIDQLERGDANRMGSFTGRRLVFPVRVGRNRGRGAGTLDGTTLPAAGNQQAQDGIVTIKSLAQGVELSHQVIEQSKSNEGAFVAALTDETTRAAVDLRRDVTRMAYGTGDGLLASCTATQSARTISVDSGQYIAVGDPVDVLTRSTGASKGTGSVTAVTYTGAADASTSAQADITLSVSVSVTNADGVYIAGNRNNESDGLRNIIATNRRLHSLDSSSLPIWNGNVYAAGTTAPAENMFMEQAQRAQQISGKRIDVYVTTPGIQLRLAGQYQSQKRWTDANSVKIDGGYSAINIAAGGRPIPVVSDTDCPNGWAFGLNKDTFAWSEMGKPDWMKDPAGGGVAWQLKTGPTAGTYQSFWQTWFLWFATLVNVQPNANVAISGLRDAVPVPRF